MNFFTVKRNYRSFLSTLIFLLFLIVTSCSIISDPWKSPYPDTCFVFYFFEDRHPSEYKNRIQYLEKKTKELSLRDHQ